MVFAADYKGITYVKSSTLAGRRLTCTGLRVAGGDDLWIWLKRTVPYAALKCRVLPSMATIMSSAGTHPHKHEQSKLLTTVRGRIEAHLYSPKDCSNHVRNRWLSDCMIAISPNMQWLSTFICYCNDGVSLVTLGWTHLLKRRLRFLGPPYSIITYVLSITSYSPSTSRD